MYLFLSDYLKNIQYSKQKAAEMRQSLQGIPNRQGNVNLNAAVASINGQVGWVKFYIEEGADLDDGRVLCTAVLSLQVDVVKLLLEHTRKYIDVALIVAMYTENVEIIDLLMEHGANPELALLNAVEKRNDKMVTLFVDKGASNLKEATEYSRKPSNEKNREKIDLEFEMIEYVLPLKKKEVKKKKDSHNSKRKCV